MEQNNGVYTWCEKSTQYSIHSRRCFMTGELCSKQSRVHREREQLHRGNQINAFVVMNFSNMSDVVYKWKLRSFIESLKRYLFLKKEPDPENKGQEKTVAIACTANGEAPNDGKKWEQVEQIHVIRADSNTESNYVICDRVCQQMQIADLVIVDVSVENTNVFYEFGMAAAFGKLILPICYSESFYQMKIPQAAKDFLEEERLKHSRKAHMEKETGGAKNLEDLRKMIEHHIDCYPWRRKLFENYGIRYRKKDSRVGYTNFRDITDPVLGFSDVQYSRFPYDHEATEGPVIPVGTAVPETWNDDDKKSEEEKNPYYFDVADDKDRKKVGYHLYNRLRASYNKNIPDPAGNSIYNTLVVYTMDGVLNADQAGQCIINYYRNMTARIREAHCFCGDRVGILGQGNKILDDPKDTKTDQELMYKVSDIIRIGMNEATHMALQQKIKTGDFLDVERPENAAGTDDAWMDETLRFVKEHIRNRCIPAYPDEPIYVKQLTQGVQKGILKLKGAVQYSHEKFPKLKLISPNKENEADWYFFNLFHVMLHTLTYTNEIVVDLSRNSLQALFWLGVAHGSDVHAITVRHMPTEQERKRSGEPEGPDERHIFDVAGLWTAILSSNDTDGFYRQLAKAQVGIEQSNKLILPDPEKYEERVLEECHEPAPYMKGGYQSFQELMTSLENKKAPDGDDVKKMNDLLQQIQKNKRLCNIWDSLTRQNQKESNRLESYYRTCFWRRMLRKNALRLYIQEDLGRTEGTQQIRRVNFSWDVNAAAELSHYLSKRLMIGSYRQTMLSENSPLPKVENQNFITIGNDTKPLEGKDGKRKTLVAYARDALGSVIPRVMLKKEEQCPDKKTEETKPIRGFEEQCPEEEKRPDKKTEEKKLIRGFYEKDTEAGARDVELWFPTEKCINGMEGETCKCEKSADGCYGQLAQMVLWREADDDRTEMRFRVSLVGVSGPATLALTSLLVDPKQQEDLFSQDLEEKEKKKMPPQHLLNQLQTSIRKEFLKEYNAHLEKRMDGELLKEVWYATNLYLSTVLYQYFFPFLTIADEKRITNGMKAFLMSDKRIGEETLVGNVIGALEDTMKSLQGVEALYTVTVKYSSTDKDSRQPRKIEPLEDKGVSCLFRKEQAQNEDKQE